MSKLFFFGRFPAYKEVGGVTTFTYNFSMKFKDLNLHVIDFYPAIDKKIPKGVSYRLITGNALVRFLSLFLFCFKNEGNYIFNFSSVRSLIFMAILPKRKNSKWLAIFHNGEQKKNYSSMGIVGRFIFRKYLMKIDIIGCLSEKQYDFFKLFQVNDLQKVSPYIPKTTSLERKKDRKSGQAVPNILISGFPTKIYRLIETIELLNKMTDLGYTYNLNVCLYGFDNEGLKEKIVKKISSNINMQLHEYLDEKEFSSVLNETNLYLRLNSVDSFGLVVAEAIDRKVDVLATNVCERYPGTFLVDVDDFDTVYDELIFYFKNNQFSERLQVQTATTELVDYASLIKKLEQ